VSFRLRAIKEFPRATNSVKRSLLISRSRLIVCIQFRQSVGYNDGLFALRLEPHDEQRESFCEYAGTKAAMRRNSLGRLIRKVIDAL
jgi:hypothetical protein